MFGHFFVDGLVDAVGEDDGAGHEHGYEACYDDEDLAAGEMLVSVSWSILGDVCFGSAGRYADLSGLTALLDVGTHLLVLRVLLPFRARWDRCMFAACLLP